MATDRYDDEYDDAPRRPRRGDPDRAKGKVLGPAIGLIVTAVLALGLTVVGFLTQPPGGVAAQFAEQRKAQLEQLDKQQVPAAQKQQQAEMINKIYDFLDKIAPAFPVLNGLLVVGSLLILFGGVQMARLKSRGLGLTASVLAMIPFFSSCCCVLGLPVGIWAIVTLNQQDVKAAFAAGGPRDDFADDRV